MGPYSSRINLHTQDLIDAIHLQGETVGTSTISLIYIQTTLILKDIYEIKLHSLDIHIVYSGAKKQMAAAS